MTNPIFEDWTAPYGAPPLNRIGAEHFGPAYTRALAEHTAEIAAIAGDPAPPSFDNVVLALEKSGTLLTKVEGIFHNLTSAATNEALQAIDPKSQPAMTRALCAEVKDRIDGKPGQAVTLDANLRYVTVNANINFIPAGGDKLIHTIVDKAQVIDNK